MKILLVTRNLPPLVGGMERLNWHMADELTKYAEVTIVGPEEASDHKPENTILVGAPLRPLWRFLLSAGWRAIKTARQLKPDVIIAGSGLTAPLVLIAARLCDAKAVCYVHGLDIAVKHPIYRAIWLPAIKRMDRIIANSTPTAALVSDLNVKSGRLSVVYPGVNLPNRMPMTEEINLFRKKYDLDQKKILLSVGRLAERKGLKEFVQFSLPEIVRNQPDAILLVIGSLPINSLHAKAHTPDAVMTEAKQLGVDKNVKFIGTVDEATLQQAYYASDVHVFPVKEISGDPEGFGMVAIEAAAHGLPTVGFASGGIVDAVKDQHSGFLVTPNDYKELTKKILSFLRDEFSFNHSCSEFSHDFSWENFGRHIINNIQEKEDNRP